MSAFVKCLQVSFLYNCTGPENIHTPTEGIGISWGVGDSVRPKNLKKCVKLYWNFQIGGQGGGGGLL